MHLPDCNDNKPQGNSIKVATFYDEDSCTFSYVIHDPQTSHCAVIDPVLDFDYASGTTSTEGADAIVSYVETHQLSVQWLLETHVHADHLSAAPYLQKKLGGKLGIGEHITVVQETFGQIFNVEDEFTRDGSQFGQLFADGDEFQLGSHTVRVMHTPGHTPACVTYLIDNLAFVGDTLFMHDAGTARADFPGGDAGTLYDSTQKILNLPDDTLIYLCHDYRPDGRELKYVTNVADSRTLNIHVGKTNKSDFVALRETRDKTLSMPRLILPALQVNMRAGHFPEAESDGHIYLKVPINRFT